MAGLLSAAKIAVELPMAWVGFQPFEGPITGYGTQNLRSCSVVLVASRYDAIMAHLPALKQWTRSLAFIGKRNWITSLDQTKHG